MAAAGPDVGPDDGPHEGPDVGVGASGAWGWVGVGWQRAVDVISARVSMRARGRLRRRVWASGGAEK